MGKRLCSVLWFAMLIFLAPDRMFAQEEFSIDRLDVQKGLLSNFVTKTISDDKQFKYFATEAGISRFDGYGFKHYRPMPGINGLVNENIETLFSSKSGFVWIGTKTGGLSRLDVKTQALENWNDVFSGFTSKPLRIVSLTEDKTGHIWVGSFNMGCFRLDTKTRKIVEHFPSGSTIYNMICDTNGTVWFTDAKTLCAYNSQENALKRFPLSFYVYNICEDTARKRIWAVGNNSAKVGLGFLDQLNHAFTAVPLDLEARFLSSIAIDQKMRIWLGSWGNGLFVSDPSVSKFQKVSTSGFTDLISSTNRNAITNIYIDQNGIAWLSTSYGGVLILYPNKGFRNVANNQKQEMRDYNVTAMNSTAGNQLLSGSISLGLYNVGSPREPGFSRNELLPPSRVNQIYEAASKYFIATNEGLYIFSQGLQRAPERYFPGEKITSVLLTAKQELWAGTQQHGLLKMKFDGKPDTAAATSFNESTTATGQIENDRINKIIQDVQGNLWIATHSGINFWDAQKQQLVSHKKLFADKLPGIIVHDLLVSNQLMYLATPNGLFKIQIEGRGAAPNLKVLEHYNEGRALVNQFICSVQEDRNGNIWFSSTTGISKLNNLTGVVHHFGKQDGVQINAFHITSSHRDSTGVLYFGGDNGFVFFNPEAVIATYQNPTLIVTGLNINNKPLEVELQGTDKKILTQAIQYTNSVSLDYANNDIAVQFAANDYLGTENISYAYKLDPLDKDWIILGKKNEVSFTGLKPGNYDLSIRANRNNQGWGEPTVMSLRIAYPPWLAWYAWVLYTLGALAILFVIRKTRLRQEKLKIELQRVQFEKEKEHEINEAKINFFTNISHEFRTPLTLILSPCTELLSRNDLNSPDLQKISLVKSNAQKLLRLINQLLDFRKSEHGLLSLRTRSEDIKLLVQGLLNDFAPAALAKKIEMKLEADGQEIIVDIDKAQMEMAINNLISNAIKFTPVNGKVWVRIKSDGQLLNLEVCDNGIGIEPIHQEKIFNRFYQVSSSDMQQGGSGIGLAFAKNIVELHNGTISVSSAPGKGTVFTISIPLIRATEKSSVLSDDDMEHDEEMPGAVTLSATAGMQSNKQSVLVVDDNEDIRQYLAGLLKDEFEVLEAEN
ncbi:MAG TPA: ATP-binding protein, partial [Chitinophagaceae bacterium]|nr:ATP-binding protein [Chitinophagaceae bacterium]